MTCAPLQPYPGLGRPHVSTCIMDFIFFFFLGTLVPCVTAGRPPSLAPYHLWLVVGVTRQWVRAGLVVIS